MPIPKNYWKNLIKLSRRETLLDPLVAVFHVTDKCNLDCAYCEDYGARLNHLAQKSLSLEDAVRVLRTVRTGVENLILTGGEPLLYPEIDELVKRAKEELKFKHVTMLTNGTLLKQHENILPHLDRLVISLDAVNAEQWTRILRSPIKMAQSIINNIVEYAARQKMYGYQLVVNCVLTLETIGMADDIFGFCQRNGILISFSPQSVNNWPSYDLFTSEEYAGLLDRIGEIKREDKMVLGSRKYIQAMKELKPYYCYPTLVPRILPNGDLIYPCRPIEKQGNGFGGRPVNLLDVETWAAAMEVAVDEYGPPPSMCSSCFQQCYVEPSLMQAYPLAFLGEMLFYPQNRKGAVGIHAPG